MTTRLERRVKSWGEIALTRPPTSNPFRLLVDRECQLRPPNSIDGSARLSLYVPAVSGVGGPLHRSHRFNPQRVTKKVTRYTCFARSALCTGNLYGLYVLVVFFLRDTVLTLPETSVVGLLVTAAPSITITA